MIRQSSSAGLCKHLHSYDKKFMLNFCKRKKEKEFIKESIFVLQFNKNYYQIFNQHPRLCETIKFHPKQKNIFLGAKMLYLGFWAGMLKNHCHICNQRPPIYLVAKFSAKIRILKFGTKNALFRCFEQKF